jgi:hypothetical protein
MPIKLTPDQLAIMATITKFSGSLGLLGVFLFMFVKRLEFILDFLALSKVS